MSRLRWQNLRQSFWFLPALFCAGAVVVAEALIYFDRRVDEFDLGPFGFLVNRVGESGSRDLLSAIAGSTLAVASTSFSITIAVLTLASSTYGPRLVRNFMADRGNQFVLGVLVATFLYSLLVLRSIRVIADTGDEYFVPHLAVNLAVLLAVLSIGVLVYFIHHISDSVQVWTLAREVRDDLLDAVDRLYPDSLGHDAQDIDGADGRGDVPPDLLLDGVAVTSHDIGYVQGVDDKALLDLATEHDVVIALRIRPGDHVIEGSSLAVICPAARADDHQWGKVRAAVRIGPARTPHEDVEFSVRLLEEMAVRALSPGTNDPYTAVNALDDLSAGLARLAGRRTPSPYRYDGRGQLRVVAPRVVLVDLVDRVMDAMRAYAVEHPNVLHRTLTLVELVGVATPEPAARARMDIQVQRLVEAFGRTDPQDCDREELDRHATRIRRALAGAVVDGHPARWRADEDDLGTWMSR